MRRREFIAALGSAAVWPVLARAQNVPVLGYLGSASATTSPHLAAAFRQGLQETGFAEGRNVAIEFRWAESRFEQLPAMVDDLLSQGVAVLIATGGASVALAAKSATSTTPIVFSVGGDPVKMGLVDSLNRPGGNATGVVILTSDLGSKRLGILRELVPNVSSVAVLLNPKSPDYDPQVTDIETAARSVGQTFQLLGASSEPDLEAAFATISASRAGAVLVGADPLLSSMRGRLVALAAQYRLPTLYEFRELTEAGGLMSYGPDRRVSNRLVGVYAGRILKGEKNRPTCQSFNQIDLS